MVDYYDKTNEMCIYTPDIYFSGLYNGLWEMDNIEQRCICPCYVIDRKNKGKI